MLKVQRTLFRSVVIMVLLGVFASADNAPRADVTGDCRVDIQDFCYFANCWLEGELVPAKADLFPVEQGDGVIDAGDLTVMASQWLEELENPYPVDNLSLAYQSAANYILGQTDFTNRGYCFVYGAGQGRLAYELAVRSQFNIIGAEADGAKVDSGRIVLHDADVYGDRITLHKGSLTNMRYRDYAAVLVVSDAIIETGHCPGSASEMFRMVRPDGGVAIIGQPAGCANVLERTELESWLNAAGLNYTITEDSDGIWAKVVRGALPGAGKWTHMWADAANTACSGDTRITDDFGVLWFGEPGPRVLIDRHWRPMAPLYNKGKLIVPGNDNIICADAYNGARLWKVDFPKAARIAILRDSGWLAMGDVYLYAAIDKDCYKIDLDTGKILSIWQPPTPNKDWGYVAIEGNLLFGSEQKVGASRFAADYMLQGKDGNQIARLDDQPTVVSTGLFCSDRLSGDVQWEYRNNSVIANPTICIGDDGVYFIESYAPAAVSDADGKVAPTVFCGGNDEYFVKLNKQTGHVVWRQQHNLPFENIIYLSYANGIALASGCTTGSSRFRYHYRAIDTSDGSLAWQKDWDSTHNSSDKEHGGQDKHPMLAGDAVYLKFGSYNLQTGTSLGVTFSTSNCADCSASSTHFFSRDGGNPTIYNINTGAKSKLCSAMRPGCYISIIPAGGIMVLPAYSAGCTCGYTLQTSIGWIPR